MQNKPWWTAKDRSEYDCPRRIHTRAVDGLLCWRDIGQAFIARSMDDTPEVLCASLSLRLRMEWDDEGILTMADNMRPLDPAALAAWAVAERVRLEAELAEARVRERKRDPGWRYLAGEDPRMTIFNLTARLDGLAPLLPPVAQGM